MPSRQRYSKKSFFRGIRLRYRTLFFEKLRLAADRNPKKSSRGIPRGPSGRVAVGTVRHIMGPLASARAAFVPVTPRRPHKFCRSDFTGDIYIRKIPLSCFVRHPCGAAESAAEAVSCALRWRAGCGGGESPTSRTANRKLCVEQLYGALSRPCPCDTAVFMVGTGRRGISDARFFAFLPVICYLCVSKWGPRG